MSPRGMVIGKIDIKGPSKRGEATFELTAPVEQAIQALTEEIEKEPLPIEHRRHLQRYYGVLRGETSGEVPDDGEHD